MREKLLCLAPVSPTPLPKEYVHQTLGSWIDFNQVDVAVIRAGHNEDELLDEAKDATFIVSYGTHRIPITREVMETAENLKLIQQLGVGFDEVDLKAAGKLGIPVCTTRGSNASTVAEHTIMTVLMILKKAIYAHTSTREGKWEQVPLGTTGALGELRGKTVGLIGLGSIGKEVARLAKAFRADVVYNKRTRLTEMEEKELGATYVTLPQLIRGSDIISLHVPLTEETKGIIGEAEFGAMKDGAIIVNTARGELIDERPLINALDSGKLRGAAIDVFTPEPPKKDSPILMHENTVLSPHISGISKEWINRAYKMSGENIARVLNGENPQNQVG